MAADGIVHDSYYGTGICGRDYSKYYAWLECVELFGYAVSGVGTDMRAVYVSVVYNQLSRDYFE